MGGDFQDALLKIVIESIPCIFLVQSAIGLKVFSHSFNSVSWFLSTLFCIYILSPIRDFAKIQQADIVNNSNCWRE